MRGGPCTAEVARSVSEVPAEAWDRLVAGDPDGLPFLRHAFLAALEETGCASARSGWEPAHLLLRRGQELVGLAPAFVKTHSLGEFVYDFAWADAFMRHGLRYYPKLVIAAPFSPAAGRRIFADPSAGPADQQEVRALLLAAAWELAVDRGLSGVHLLFGHPGDIAVAADAGFAVRTGCQFHWRNEDYASFDAFLARFPSHRRNQIRRERRQVAEAGVSVTHHAGAAIEDGWRDAAFAFYGATIDRYVHGRRYLNAAFFERLWSDLRDHLQLTLAWRGGRIVGGALNVVHGPRRLGRYWGGLEEVPGLHFEVCAYAAIEDCIARRVGVFEAGAGGESHKLRRGFLPALTSSAHALVHRPLHDAVADFCAREAAHIHAEAEVLAREVFAR